MLLYHAQSEDGCHCIVAMHIDIPHKNDVMKRQPPNASVACCNLITCSDWSNNHTKSRIET